MMSLSIKIFAKNTPNDANEAEAKKEEKSRIAEKANLETKVTE